MARKSSAVLADSKKSVDSKRILTQHIAKWKQGMEIFARMLTDNYDARVIFRGTQAGTNGRTIVVPDVSLLARDNLTREEIDEALRLLKAVKGYIWHEGAHLIHTDMAAPRVVAVMEEHGAQFHHLNNGLEDIRIEHRVGHDWRGGKQVLDFVRQQYVWPRMAEGYTEDNAEESDDPSEHFGQIVTGLQVIANHPDDYEDHFLWQSLREENQATAARFEDECREIKPQAFLTKSAGTWACIETSLRIWEQLKEDHEEASAASGDDGDSDEKGSGKAPTLVVVLGDPGGSESDSEPSSEGDPGAETSEEKGAEKGAEGSEEGDTDTSEGEGSEEGDTDGSETPSEPRSIDGRPITAVEGSEGSEGAVERSEGTRMRTVDVDALAKGSKEETEATAEAIAKAITEAMDEAALNLLKEYDDHPATKTRLGKPYLVYTTEDDVVGKRPDIKSPSEAGERLKALRDKTHRLCGPVKRRLQNLLRTLSRRKLRGELLEGDMLHEDSLCDLATGTSKRVFATLVDRWTLKDTVVMLLIDASGSMAGGEYDEETGEAVSRVQIAKQVAFAFGECLHAAKIPFAVSSFTSHGGDADQYRYNTATATEKKLFSRWGNLYFLTAKHFHESWLHTAQYVSYMDERLDQNHDAEAVRWAAQMLLQQKQKRKVLLVLSDGYPATGEPGKAHEAQRVYLHEVVHNMRVEGVEVVGFGIDTRSVHEYYKPWSVEINRLAEVPDVVLNQMKFLLTNQKRR